MVIKDCPSARDPVAAIRAAELLLLLLALSRDPCLHPYLREILGPCPVPSPELPWAGRERLCHVRAGPEYDVRGETSGCLETPAQPCPDPSRPGPTFLTGCQSQAWPEQSHHTCEPARQHSQETRCRWRCPRSAGRRVSAQTSCARLNTSCDSLSAPKSVDLRPGPFEALPRVKRSRALKGPERGGPAALFHTGMQRPLVT